MQSEESALEKCKEDRKRGEFCDATIKVGQETFPVHKDVLTASSSYFRAMFTGSFAEKDKTEVEMKGVSADSFGLILDYLYKAPTNLTVENVKDVWIAADMLCIDALTKECKEWLYSTWREGRRSDFMGMYNAMTFFNMTDRIDYLCRYSLKKLFSDRSRYLELPYELLLTILQAWRLLNQLESEYLIAENIVKWVLYRPEERLGDEANHLISLIQFQLVSSRWYDDIVKLFDCGEHKGLSKLKAFVEERYKISRKWCHVVNLLQVVLIDRCSFPIVYEGENRKWKGIALKGKRFFSRKVLLDNGNLYTFSTRGGSMINLDTETLIEFPNFPEDRSGFAYTSAGNSVVVMGGRKGYTSEPLDDVLTLDIEHNVWKCCDSIFGNKVMAGSIEYKNSIYVVGAEKNMEWDSKPKIELYVYNTITECFSKVCDLCNAQSWRLLTHDEFGPKLAIYEGILYVFWSGVPLPDRVDLSTHEYIAAPKGQQMTYCFSFRILDVCTVDCGIVIAYQYCDRILLVLLRPSDSWETEPLRMFFSAEPILCDKPPVLIGRK